jgi:hypothetical protein
MCRQEKFYPFSAQNEENVPKTAAGHISAGSVQATSRNRLVEMNVPSIELAPCRSPFRYSIARTANPMTLTNFPDAKGGAVTNSDSSAHFAISM